VEDELGLGLRHADAREHPVRAALHQEARHLLRPRVDVVVELQRAALERGEARAGVGLAPGGLQRDGALAVGERLVVALQLGERRRAV